MLTRDDEAVIVALARHYRCPLSEVEEMRVLAASDPDTMDGYRRMAGKITPPAQSRVSEAYLTAMEQLKTLGVRRRRA